VGKGNGHFGRFAHNPEGELRGPGIFLIFIACNPLKWLDSKK
jgi:hypothetical protein